MELLPFDNQLEQDCPPLSVHRCLSDYIGLSILCLLFRGHNITLSDDLQKVLLLAVKCAIKQNARKCNRETSYGGPCSLTVCRTS